MVEEDVLFRREILRLARLAAPHVTAIGVDRGYGPTTE